MAALAVKMGRSIGTHPITARAKQGPVVLGLNALAPAGMAGVAGARGGRSRPVTIGTINQGGNQGMGSLPPTGRAGGKG